VAALGLAVVVERRVPAPLIDLTLFRSRLFSLSLVSLMLSMVGFVSVGFMLPFYFEELQGLSTSTAGLLLTPMAVALAVCAPLSGTLADRFGSRWLAPLGLGCSCLGLLALSRLGTTEGPLDIAWRLVLVGVGQGLFQSPTTRALMAAATAAEQGEASGIQGTSRVVAQGLGVALASAVFAVSGGAAAGAMLAATESGVGLPAAQVAALRAGFLAGYQAALLTCAVAVGIGALVSLFRGRDA
jgi:MFS family permease